MSNDRLGVIGGMGPQATNTFYQYIIDRTDARTDQEHLSVLIFSDCAMPDRTAAILGTQAQKDEVYERLLSDARMLEGAGCTAIAVPCNTSHYFLDRVQEQISIPIVHMIRETARLLVSQGKKRPGILATDGTVQTGIYQRECAARGMEGVTPPADVQKLVMSIIYDEIKRGESGSREKFAAIDRDLRSRGCDGAILACTELSVYKEYHGVSELYLDAMDVLAEESIRACGYPLRSV